MREFEADINVVDAKIEKRVQYAHALFSPRVLDRDKTTSVEQREDRWSAKDLIDLEELLVDQLGRNWLLLFLPLRRAISIGEGVVRIIFSIYTDHLTVSFVLGLKRRAKGLAGLLKIF